MADEATRRRQRRAHCRAIGRLGGLTTSAAYDSRERTAAGRASFARSFEAKVRAEFPDIEDDEVERRAGALRKLHYARMGLASAAARFPKVRASDSQSTAPDGAK